MALTPGTRIGSYEIAAQIARRAGRLVVVQNWYEELKRLVPVD